MNPQCKTCRWFARVGTTANGECRYIEPVCDHAGRATWPKLTETDYCGKHETPPAPPTP